MKGIALALRLTAVSKPVSDLSGWDGGRKRREREKCSILVKAVTVAGGGQPVHVRTRQSRRPKAGGRCQNTLNGVDPWIGGRQSSLPFSVRHGLESFALCGLVMGEVVSNTYRDETAVGGVE